MCYFTYEIMKLFSYVRILRWGIIDTSYPSGFWLVWSVSLVRIVPVFARGWGGEWEGVVLAPVERREGVSRQLRGK